MSELTIHDASVIVHSLVPEFPILPKLSIYEDQQILCPMHSDSQKSARVYSGGKTMYCFTCKRSWRPATMMFEAFEQAGQALSWPEIFRLINSRGFTVEKYATSDSANDLNTVSLDTMFDTPTDFDQLMLFVLHYVPEDSDLYELLDKIYVDYIDGNEEADAVLLYILLDSFGVDVDQIKRDLKDVY